MHTHAWVHARTRRRTRTCTRTRICRVLQAALRALTVCVEAHAHERRILVATLGVLQARRAPQCVLGLVGRADLAADIIMHWGTNSRTRGYEHSHEGYEYSH